MKKYKLTSSGVYDNENNKCIPNAIGNIDWGEYLEWVANGNTPDPEYSSQELEDKLFEQMRQERNFKLSTTDYMMTVDYYNSVLTEEQRSQVTEYRSALRDLPENIIDINDINWPQEPIF